MIYVICVQRGCAAKLMINEHQISVISFKRNRDPDPILKQFPVI